MDFRKGILAGLDAKCDAPLRLSHYRESVLELADALAGVNFGDSLPDGIFDALRCLIYDMWSDIPVLDQEIEERLGNSLAGIVLGMMKKHHAEREAARAEFSPEKVKARRDAKRLLRQEQHLQRLSRKQERDRLWKLQHQGDTTVTLVMDNDGARPA
jgi:hypothetical protein